MQAPKPSPLILIVNPPGPQTGTPGTEVDLFVTVSNQGSQSAVIDIFIDESARDLRQWCDAPRQRLALDPQQSTEVKFAFKIPIQAFPATYEYVLVVDAPEHYPEDTPIQRQRQLILLPLTNTGVRISDPTFALKPKTTPMQPLVLKPVPGQPGQVQAVPLSITVSNRSDRVDRFRLECSDLDETWFAVKYSGPALNGPGMIESSECLNLNPNEQGTISLTFRPPAFTLAGSYSPTIQIISSNQPALSMLDLVYLTVPAIHDLQVEMEILLGKVSRSQGRYAIKFYNPGNSIRELAISAKSCDEEEGCEYTCEPAKIRLLPGKSTAVELTVKPKNWWQRPLWGASLLFNFQVDLEDARGLPLPKERPKGILEWLPRPLWQLLLLILGVLGLLAALGYLLYLIFYKPAPPIPPPVVTVFEPVGLPYSADNASKITLRFTVTHADQLQQIKLHAAGADDQPLPNVKDQVFPANSPETSIKNGTFPDGCGLDETKSFACANYPTGISKPGTYKFTLELQDKNDLTKVTPVKMARAVKINPKKVAPIPPPKILFFSLNGQKAPTKVTLAIKTLTSPGEPVNLAWEVQGKGVTVEIPGYGKQAQLRGSLSLPPYRQITKDTFTLKASNKSITGAIQSDTDRQITVETYDPTPPPSVPAQTSIPTTPPAQKPGAKPISQAPKKPLAGGGLKAAPASVQNDPPILRPVLPTQN
ncbi:MAG: hypothetical protein H7Y37_16935 [Anaerolineae bacterium]|nr:hypothetical protein [Gloeobacterales cyanobacterium ES-bin-313]